MNIAKYLFFAGIVKPFVKLIVGVSVHGGEHLPLSGPAILVANHNSHLDALVLMSLYSSTKIGCIHPMAAADYFCNTPFKKFFFKKLIGIIPLKRNPFLQMHQDIFAEAKKALKQKEILIIFPEGTRGTNNHLQDFKTGIAHLTQDLSKVPVIPIFIHGTDKSLPKNEGLFVPFITDIYIGKALFHKKEDNKKWTFALQEQVRQLQEQFFKEHPALNK
ncbi:MAG: 1-acyl-sn-glycerol-3-phosphate acyltransferase [Alphaproteobacteria bacterium]|nr:1-acyl-sn-glycerol-3-phosphate acyltransferase [Alphaproteobacteria bacterium]